MCRDHGVQSMRWLLGVAFLLAWGAWPVSAAELVVQFTDGHGHAVSDAVVTLTSDQPASVTTPPQPAATRYIDQKHETFIPYVQILRPGDKVIFRNSDTTRHHVYSFSGIKKFEFVLRPGDSSPALVMDKVGIAAVGCNIHDHMSTYLFVSGATAVAMSDQDGNATLDNLVPGHYTMHVWHPQLHPGQAQPTQAVNIANDSDNPHVALALSLIPDPRMEMDDDD